MKGVGGMEGAQEDGQDSDKAIGGAVPAARIGPMAESPAEPSLAQTLAELAEQVRANNARAEARERVIDWLRKEVEQLKRGENSVLLRPVVTDLQHLRSDLLRQARTLPADINQR